MGWEIAREKQKNSSYTLIVNYLIEELGLVYSSEKSENQQDFVFTHNFPIMFPVFLFFNVYPLTFAAKFEN